MSIYDLQTESGIIAYKFLNWQPPLALEAAVIKLNQMSFNSNELRDQELNRLTTFWSANGLLIELSNFRYDSRRAVELLMEHQARGHSVITEKFSGGLVTVIYPDQNSTEPVGSGSGITETESIFDATLSFLNRKMEDVSQHV